MRESKLISSHVSVGSFVSGKCDRDVIPSATDRHTLLCRAHGACPRQRNIYKQTERLVSYTLFVFFLSVFHFHFRYFHLQLLSLCIYLASHTRTNNKQTMLKIITSKSNVPHIKLSFHFLKEVKQEALCLPQETKSSC